MPSTRLRDDEKMARKAGWASFVGTTVEWYDFYIYGLASALVFAPLFFSAVPPSIGVLLSFATFWIGFLARPVGAIVFGHLGDRIGRKKALVTTLMLMGISTVGVGLLPTYAQAGIAAPLLLTLLRAVQGLAVGGEWGGAVLIATEHAKKERGFLFGAFAQQGSPAGRILATVAFLAVSQLPTDALLGWAWRVPFLASAVLVIVGLVIRLSLEESPAFAALKSSQRTERIPLVTLVRGHTRPVLLGVAAVLVVFMLAYARDTFALAWATNQLGFTRDGFLTIILVASLVQFVVQPFGAVLATHWNVRKVVSVLLALEVVVLPMMFVLISTGSYPLAMLGAVLATVPDVMYYSIMAGMFAQAFPAHVRYTGIAGTYALAGMVGGAMPLILQSLLTGSGSIWASVGFVVVTCLASLFGARAMLTLSARRQAAEAGPQRTPAAGQRRGEHAR
jgi:hypothetical protein